MGVYVGLDIGGTKFLVAAADENGKILRKIKSATPYDLNEGLSLLKKMIYDVADGEKILSIGASIGGPLDWKKGIVSPLHQKEWRKVPLKEIMEKEFSCPFYVDVDTNIAALGEFEARGKGNILYITISTGMGGGFIFNGQIYRSSSGEHPEIAHQCINSEKNVICECGAKNCLEEFVSGNGISRLYKKPAERLTDDEWKEVGTNLGQGLRNLSVIYTPDVIAIGGGVALNAPEIFLRTAKDVMTKNLKIVPVPKIELSVLGYETPLVGTIYLAMNGKKLGY